MEDLTWKHSQAIYSGLWDDYSQDCQGFIERAQEIGLPFPDTATIEECVAHLNLLISAGCDQASLWLELTNGLQPAFSGDKEFAAEVLVGLLDRCARCFSEGGQTAQEYSTQSDERWLQWAQAVEKAGIPAYEWVVPTDNIVTLLAAKVAPGSRLDAGVAAMTKYSLKASIRGWTGLVNACVSYIQHNHGGGANVHSPDVIEMLLWIDLHSPACGSKIKPLMRKGQVYNMIQHLGAKEGLLVPAAVLMARHLGPDMHSTSIPGVEQSAAGVEKVRSVWTGRNKEHAKAIWTLTLEADALLLLWEIGKNEHNKLFLDVCDIAISEQCGAFFSGADSLTRFRLLFQLMPPEIRGKIADLFLQHADIDADIQACDGPEIIEAAEELDLLAKRTKNGGVIRHLSKQLVGLDQSNWETALKEDDPLLTLAFTVKTQDPTLALRNPFLEALVALAGDWSRKSRNPADSQVEDWLKLFGLLDQDFQANFRLKVTKLLVSKKFSVPEQFFESNKSLFDRASLVADPNRSIAEAAQDATRSGGDFSRLRILDWILGDPSARNFKVPADLPEVLRDPLRSLLDSSEDEEKTQLLGRLAKAFGVIVSARPSIESPSDAESEDAGQ